MQKLHGLLHNAQGTNTLAVRVIRRKPITDVRLAERAEDGIRQGMAQHIGIAVPLQPLGVVYLHPAQPQGTRLDGEAVYIISQSYQCIHIQFQ